MGSLNGRLCAPSLIAAFCSPSSGSAKYGRLWEYGGESYRGPEIDSLRGKCRPSWRPAFSPSLPPEGACAPPAVRLTAVLLRECMHGRFPGSATTLKSGALITCRYPYLSHLFSGEKNWAFHRGGLFSSVPYPTHYVEEGVPSPRLAVLYTMYTICSEKASERVLTFVLCKNYGSTFIIPVCTVNFQLAFNLFFF